MNSVAARSAQGPVQPKSEIVTTTARGESASSRCGSMPSGSRLRSGGGHDHDVGAGQLGRSRSESGAGHAALAGVEVAEQRRVLAVRDRRTASGEAAQRISLRRFDLRTSAPASTSSLPQYAAGDPVADLDDAQILKRCRAAVGARTHVCLPLEELSWAPASADGYLCHYC